ncbi:MAG: DUF885 domain-containing protein [Acidobacteriales bacterium]|nr:DUF885 domain-containing protein [Terriglobales bacterium]
MKRIIMLCCIALLSEVCMGQTVNKASRSLHALLESDWNYLMQQYPEAATITGYPGQNDRWTDLSPSAVESRKRHIEQSLATLQKIDSTHLNPRDSLDYDLYLSTLTEAVEGSKFGLEYRVQGLADLYMPVDQLGGVHQDIARTIEFMPARSEADYQQIVARLKSAPRFVEQTIVWMRAGMEKGLTPPQVILHDVPEQISALTTLNPDDSALFAPFRAFPQGISAAHRAELSAAAREAISSGVFPSFRKLLAFLRDEYIPAARKTLAQTALPDGERRYKFWVRYNTTLSLSPEGIHRIGLNEVKRIRQEMDKVIASSHPDMTFQQFVRFLQTEDRFYFSKPAELLSAYRDLGKQAHAASVRFFRNLPRLPYGIEAFPAYMEKSQPSGRYVRGSVDAGRPGVFFVNTYDLRARPKWGMHAMIVHEAVPGHHFQKALAQEIAGNPPLRVWRDLPAFEEGWGLYCETFASELGFYQDPYSKFGQLSDELLRAIRLVVDTGLHKFGWTREQSIAFFKENSPLAMQDVVVEVDRYLVWPGQALSYKLGELTIRRLRATATRELGDKFDLRSFHDAILEAGPVPLEILEARIKQRIRARDLRPRSANP